MSRGLRALTLALGHAHLRGQTQSQQLRLNDNRNVSWVDINVDERGVEVAGHMHGQEEVTRSTLLVPEEIPPAFILLTDITVKNK